MRMNDYLTQLGAGKPQTQTPESVAVANEIRKVPYLDFCEVSPAKKMGFDGFLDESGSFAPFAFSCTKLELVTLTGHLEHHYSKTVGASYGQLAMSLYLAAAARHAKSTDLQAALWATEWLGRIVHEGSSLGGYKPKTVIYHNGLTRSVGGKAVLALWDEKTGECFEWFRNQDEAVKQAPKHAELFTGAEAMVHCVRMGLGETLTCVQAEWLLVVKKVLTCQADIENRKQKLRYADETLFGGTVFEFAAVAGMLRRSSKGIQISEHAMKADTFEAGSEEDTLLVDHVTDEVIKKFLGESSITAKVALVAKNVHTRLADARRQIDEEANY